MKITTFEEPLRAASIKTWIRKSIVDYVTKKLAYIVQEIEQELVELDENIISIKDISWDRIFSSIKKVFNYDSPSLYSHNLPGLEQYIQRYIEGFSEISLRTSPPVKIIKASVTYCDLLNDNKGIKGIIISFLIKSMEYSYPINVYLRKQLDLDSGENTIVCTTENPLFESSEDTDSCIKNDNSKCGTTYPISSCKSCYNFNICKYVDGETGPLDIAYSNIREDFDFLYASIECKYYRSEYEENT